MYVYILAYNSAYVPKNVSASACIPYVPSSVLYIVQCTVHVIV